MHANAVEPERGYMPRSPEQTLLHRVVREQLGPFLARARAREQPAPRFIEQELHAFLRCGILAHGFLRLHCDDCGHDRLVPFSCKRRGFCPSCGGRRMAESSAHLMDHVFPSAVPVRQWVLTLPYPLRYRCAYDARLTSEVLRAFLRALFAQLRRRVRRRWGVLAEQCGAVSFIQRFGSALNLNLHFHTLALDGGYAYAAGHEKTPRFLVLPPPRHDEVARVLTGTARRLHRLLEARDDGNDDALARDEPLLALLAAASLRTRIATGPQRGEPWRREGDRVDPAEPREDPDTSPRVPEHRGMSLHAAVAVPAGDRRRLERLCRYVARPPLANERLEEQPDGRLTFRLKTRWRDGTTHVLMERSELIDRLVPLIPPPRAHQVRYHGILAPCASQRDRVVPAREPELEPHAHAADSAAAGSLGNVGAAVGHPSRSALEVGSAPPPVAPTHARLSSSPRDEAQPREPDSVGAQKLPPPQTAPRRLRWAALLQRVFDLDALRCPRCGSTLRLIAAIEDPAIARRILACIGLPARAPPGAPATPSDTDMGHALQLEAPWDFDQTPMDEES